MPGIDDWQNGYLQRLMREIDTLKPYQEVMQMNDLVGIPDHGGHVRRGLADRRRPRRAAETPRGQPSSAGNCSVAGCGGG